MSKSPALSSFVGVYFNQDWPDDYGTEEAAVDAFLTNAPDDREALVSEIEWVLSNYVTEDDLGAYLDAVGNEYLPPAERGGYHGWLTRVADRVRTAI